MLDSLASAKGSMSLLTDAMTAGSSTDMNWSVRSFAFADFAAPSIRCTNFAVLAAAGPVTCAGNDPASLKNGSMRGRSSPSAEAMLFLPIGWARFDRCAGVESLESECLQFFGSLLVGLDEALQVSFDGDAFRFGAGADLYFQVPIDCQTHILSSLALHF